MALQLDFFKDEQTCELDQMRLDFAKVKDSAERVRKGQYAEIGRLKKIILDMESRLMIIERNICKGLK